MRTILMCAVLVLLVAVPVHSQTVDGVTRVVSPAVVLLPIDIGPGSGVSGLVSQDETTNPIYGVSVGKSLTPWLGVVLQGALRNDHKSASADLEVPFRGLGAFIVGAQIDNSDQLGTRIGVPIAFRFVAEVVRFDRFSVSPLMVLGGATRWDHPDAQSAQIGRDDSPAKIGGFGMAGLRLALRPVWAQFTYGWSKQKGEFYRASEDHTPGVSTGLQLHKQFVIRVGVSAK